VTRITIALDLYDIPTFKKKVGAPMLFASEGTRGIPQEGAPRQPQATCHLRHHLGNARRDICEKFLPIKQSPLSLGVLQSCL
jgi:hypothetical protein